MVSEARKYFEAMNQALTNKNLCVGELMHYHQMRVSEFQHERLIHLLVTIMVIFAALFFVGLTLIIKSLVLLPAVGILLILVLAYLVHYRKLENEVQSLYEISKRFEDLVTEIS